MLTIDSDSPDPDPEKPIAHCGRGIAEAFGLDKLPPDLIQIHDDPPPPPEPPDAPAGDAAPEDGQPQRKTRSDAAKAIPVLRPFIGRNQMQCLLDGMRGEEKQYFIDKFCDLAALVTSMPATYDQDGKGDDALVSLHYFAGGQASWYITEKDKGGPRDETPGQQTQAFGLADLFGDGGELGYISIEEILSCGGELDLHFKPRALGVLKAEREAAWQAARDRMAEARDER